MIIDTTYLLPLAKIEVPTDVFADILRGKISIDLSELSVSSISIFELQAKAAKLGIPYKHIVKAIRFIMRHLRVIDFWDKDIVEYSFELRKLLPDYISCVILATAIKHDNELLTEGTRILKIRPHIEETYGTKIIRYSDLIKNQK